MKNFRFSNLIPGLVGPETISIADTTGTFSVTGIRLTDSLLNMPADQTLDFVGRYETEYLILSISGNPVWKFANDKIVLTSLEIKIPYQENGSSNDLIPILDGANGKIIEGRGAGEIHGLPAALELTQNMIPVTVKYSHDPVGISSGFQIEIVNPVNISSLYTEMHKAAVEVTALPDEGAIILYLKGEASLNNEGKTKIRTLLDQVWTNSGLSLDTPLAFIYQQKFPIDQEFPSISFSPTWQGDPPAIPNLPDILNLSIGQPKLSLGLKRLDQVAESFEFSLQNCGITFKDIPGFTGLSLVGNLKLAFNGDNNAWEFLLQPTVSGSFTLPDILQFLILQITWLSDIKEVAELSLKELDWYQLFRNLGLDPTEEQIEGLIIAAVNAEININCIYFVVFKAFADIGASADIYDLIWKIGFNSTEAGINELIELIALLDDLQDDFVKKAFQSLLLRPELEVDQFLRKILVKGGEWFDSQYDFFMRIWSRILAQVINVLPPDEIAKILVDLWMDAPDELRARRLIKRPLLKHLNLPFQLPKFEMHPPIMMVAEALIQIMASVNAGLLKPLEGLPQTYSFLKHLVSPVTRIFGPLDRDFLPDASKILGLVGAIIDYAEGEPKREILLLEASRYPFFGILLFLVALVKAMKKPMPWLDLYGKNIEEMTDLKVKRLKPPKEDNDPTQTVKYLILSDVHRDVGDNNLEQFKFGRLDHFKGNSGLYLQILNYADENGYTVIEAGDCEELWYIRDFDEFEGYNQWWEPYKKWVEKIIGSDSVNKHNHEVYKKLRELHKKQRYFRCQGNHDSYLRDENVVQPLKDFMEADGGGAFEIYDFLIIPGVKTMGIDLGLRDDFLDSNVPFEDKLDRLKGAIVDNINTRRFLGFDSRPYNEFKQLLIAHGHQWDFWNCDEHNLLGKLITNIAAVPADSFMDPFVDTEGIAFGGTPFMNFQNIAAETLVLSSWPVFRPALKQAHDIQHQDDSRRFLNDDIMYSETMASICAVYGLPLDVYEQDINGNPVRHRVSETALIDRFGKHCGNLICLGHTHTPQCMPYHDIAGYLGGTIFSDIVQAIQDIIPFVEASLINPRSTYLNSGTAGWMEGVIWGIEVHESGQPRLVYWTKNHKEPERMDWELYPWEQSKRDAFNDAQGALFDSAEDYFHKASQLFGASVDELLAKVKTMLSLPMESFALLVQEETETGQLILEPLDISNIENFRLIADEQLNQVQNFLMKILTVLRHRRSQTSPGDARVFEVSVPLAGEIEHRLSELEGLIRNAWGETPQNALRMACTWICGLQNLVSLRRGGRILMDRLMADDKLAVLWSVIMMSAMFPSPDAPGFADIGVAAELTIESNRLKLKITVN
jgi:UDP-2,3-diacylglucosamine pyrophosphatase LpxH